MKTYLLVSSQFARTGGMDRANYALAAHLAQRGDRVHLVTHHAASSLRALPNVVVHDVARPLGWDIAGEPLLGWCGARWARSLERDGARIVVNGGNCHWGDVSWVHFVHAAHRCDSRSRIFRRAKEVWAHRNWVRGERRVLARARVVIANSARTQRDLIERVGIASAKVHVIYYGTDPACCRPASREQRRLARRLLDWDADRPIIAFVGALGDRRKGFDTLLAAWRFLCQDPGWDADLVVIGAGAELEYWMRQAAAARLCERMRFLGFRRDVPQLLMACDGLVSPTRYEAYGLAVHEALCCGIPALVSASAGVAEQVSQDLRDLLIEHPQDPTEVAGRLRVWRARLAHWRAAGERCGERLRQYTWDDMAARIAQVVER
jgi:glycosyltransferase involved in cell wall biosynthesis